MRPRPRPPARRPGFTLVELLIVMVIIGILLAFILSAAMDGVRRAEERATQSLVVKLDTGMADRVEALLTVRADANAAHEYLAAVWPTPPSGSPPIILRSNPRSQAIAQFDQIKAELPDVFVVQPRPTGLSSKNNFYPLNFAANPYYAGAASPPAGLAANGLVSYADALVHYPYMLPYGVAVQNNPLSGSFGADPPLAVVIPTTTGIYGASYTAAAGLYKSLFEKVIRDNPG
ncbi:MAG: type II secretion system GspH family protein, partial [Planctomycetia bacterium]|nr:type II secretion system GspH family protein [Planctomycetia bacterium]